MLFLYIHKIYIYIHKRGYFEECNQTVAGFHHSSKYHFVVLHRIKETHTGLKQLEGQQIITELSFLSEPSP